MLKSIVRLHAYGKPVNFLMPFLQQEKVGSVGSGTFVDPADLGVQNPRQDHLYILTCAHVVERAEKVTVVLPLKGSEQLDASVLAFVPKHNYDMAIVALPNPSGELDQFVDKLPLGSSLSLVQGEKLVALGFPMGQTGLKVSDGVFAGLQHYLQHTVSISPGNSGGPLVNQKGELIGINNAGLIHVAASNIGYAVPIEFYTMTAPRFFQRQVGTPSPDRVLRGANFGFFLQPTTLEHMKQVAAVSDDICCESGMFIFEVVQHSPAHRAGIQPGDFLCAVQNVPVDNTGVIQVPWSAQKVPIYTALERLSDPLRSFDFKVWSRSTRQCVTVQLSPRVLDVYGNKYLYPPFDTVDFENIKGCIVMPLMKNHKHYKETLATFLRLKPKQRFLPWLIVTHVEPGSPADQSQSIEPGELLVHVNGQPVNTLKQLRQALQMQMQMQIQHVTLVTDNGKTTVL
jgi:S1-C subfamily serine protease